MICVDFLNTLNKDYHSIKKVGRGWKNMRPPPLTANPFPFCGPSTTCYFVYISPSGYFTHYAVENLVSHRLHYQLCCTPTHLNLSRHVRNLTSLILWGSISSCLTCRDQNGFRRKSLKARNTELDSVCMCLLNEPQRKHPL